MHQDTGTTGPGAGREPSGAAGPDLILDQPGRRNRLILVLMLGIVVCGLATTGWYVHRGLVDPSVLACWCIGAGVLVSRARLLVADAGAGRPPAAGGRIVAIVSADEPDPDDLYACIRSILDQRGVAVDEVHVVDDGSTKRPVRPFAHPRIRWHRKERGGECAAHVYVLDRLEPDAWDFVLMINGDGVLDEHALEHHLRAFSRPGVTASTGTVAADNSGGGLLADIGDLYVGTLPMPGSGRSPVSVRETAPGATFVFRAAVAFRHRDRYLASSALGDVRVMAACAALDGEVAQVPEAITRIRMPVAVRAAYRQWWRWSTGRWCIVPWGPGSTDGGRRVLAGLSFSTRMLVALLRLVSVPIAVVASEWRGGSGWSAAALCVASSLLVRYATTGLRLARRAGTPEPAAIRTWLLLTPAEAVFTALLINPVKGMTLLRLVRHRWDAGLDGRSASSTASAPLGAVYYSGYLGKGFQS